MVRCYDSIMDLKWEQGLVSKLELEQSIKIATGKDIVIDPNARPIYTGALIITRFFGETNRSIEEIERDIAKEFFVPPIIREGRRGEIRCEVIFEANEYQELLREVKDFSGELIKKEFLRIVH